LNNLHRILIPWWNLENYTLFVSILIANQMQDCEALKLQHLIAFQNVYALIFEDHQMLTTCTDDHYTWYEHPPNWCRGVEMTFYVQSWKYIWNAIKSHNNHIIYSFNFILVISLDLQPLIIYSVKSKCKLRSKSSSHPIQWTTFIQQQQRRWRNIQPINYGKIAVSLVCMHN